MSKVVATTVLPEDSGEVLTIGDTGDAIAISGDSLNLNVLQDAGGNNMITSNGSGNLTVNDGLGGAYNLISTSTITNQAYIEITSGIDSTYDVYVFKFINIWSADGSVYFQVSAATTAHGAGSWGTDKTTTWFLARHQENGAQYSVAYQAAEDLANSASAQRLAFTVPNYASSSYSGEMHLFAPWSTTYAKNFYIRGQYQFEQASPHAMDAIVAGYYNVTAAVDKFKFYMSSGNMSGTIKLYGLSKS